MKKTITIIIPALLFVFSMVLMFDAEKIVEPVGNQAALVKLDMPDNVSNILKNSCTGCHNDASKNTKGKTKLNFDSFNDGKYSTGKQIAKLNGIAKSVSKSKMPPEKFLNKYPNRALSASDSKILIDWATAQASSLAGE